MCAKMPEFYLNLREKRKPRCRPVRKRLAEVNLRKKWRRLKSFEEDLSRFASVDLCGGVWGTEWGI